MRDYAKVSPQFWIGSTGRALRGHIEAQIVAAYLLSNPHANMIGLYYLPEMFVAHETGLPIEGASKGLARCIEVGFCGYDRGSEVVWVYEMARFQIADQLKPEDKRCAGVRNDYNTLPQNAFLSGFFDKYAPKFHLTDKRETASPIEAPSKPHRSQEQEQEQELNLTALSGNPVEIERMKHLRAEAVSVLSFLNAKASRNYQPVEANVKPLVARFREGFTPAQCRQVIAKKVREWGTDEKMETFLRPKTLFNATNFANYCGELLVSSSEAQHG